MYFQRTALSLSQGIPEGYNFFGAGAGLGLSLGIQVGAAKVAATGQLNHNGGGPSLSGGADATAAAVLGGAATRTAADPPVPSSPAGGLC